MDLAIGVDRSDAHDGLAAQDTTDELVEALVDDVVVRRLGANIRLTIRRAYV